MLLLAIFGFFLLATFRPPPNSIAYLFLAQQDAPLLAISFCLLVLTSLNPRRHKESLALSSWISVGVVVALLAIGLAGHYLILDGYDLSRDEQMATFDAQVFSSGFLVQPLPPLWRDHAAILNTLFMYPAEHREAWISAYLPVNSALRALVGTVARPEITGGLMNVISLFALWACVRKLWPQDREAPIIALLLYVGSGQVLLNSMTSYAMPSHLAFNLIWLWLYLRKSWWADATALIVGFAAVGLHQPLFHPLFVGPLLFLLLLERQWTRAIFYISGYAAICMFWLLWPNWMWRLVQADVYAQQPDGVDYITRLIGTIFDREQPTFLTMACNILRFVAWQHLLLIPLVWFGWSSIRKNSLALALTAGLCLTILIMTIILPYQGHGFGYRYLHGLLGSCILLAVYGWRSLAARQEEWRTLLLRTSLAGFVIIFPFQLWIAHALYAPAATANDRIAAADADYAVISKPSAPFASDLVYNPPALSARPIRLLAHRLDENVATAICRAGSSVVFVRDEIFDQINRYFDQSSSTAAAQASALLAPRLEAAGCRVSYLR